MNVCAGRCTIRHRLIVFMKMKEQSRELGMGDVLHFPADIRYIKYKGKTLAVAVENANWLVLGDDCAVECLERLREGKTVGEVLKSLSTAEEQKAYVKLLSAIMARQIAGQDAAPQPEFVQGYKMLNIYLTNACNLNCPHCFMKAGKRLANELTKEEWIGVLTEFKECGGKAVTFTGGEPLLHPGFSAIVESAHQLGLQVTVLTNGILWTDELIDRLSPMLVEVQMSIDGVDDASNAKVRKAGTFETLVQNVIRFSRNGVRVSVATTFTNDNIDSAPRYAELVNRINEETDKKVIFKLTKKILPGRETQYNEADNKAYEEKIRQVEEMIDPNAKYEAFMDGHTSNLVAKNCGFGGLSIAADGNVYFCNRVLEIPKQGNVREQSLQHLLELGEKAHMETGIDHVEPCRRCAIMNICGGGCRIDEYDFKGGDWVSGQAIRQEKCACPNEYLLKMMVESYEYKYSF